MEKVKRKKYLRFVIDFGNQETYQVCPGTIREFLGYFATQIGKNHAEFHCLKSPALWCYELRSDLDHIILVQVCVKD